MPTMRKKRNMSLPLIKSHNDYKWSRNTPAGANPVGGQLNLPSLIIEQSQAWRDDAACKQHQQLNFTPSTSDLPMIKACKKVCATCPVQEECLQWALEADDRFSVCGGYTYKERKAL